MSLDTIDLRVIVVLSYPFILALLLGFWLSMRLRGVKQFSLSFRFLGLSMNLTTMEGVSDGRNKPNP